MSGTTSIRTYCRVCTCQCGLVVDIKDTQIVKVKGDTAHLLSKGYSCPKGRAIGQMHHDPEGIHFPMMQQGTDMVQTSWESLLDDLAGKLREMIDAHGPASVGIFFGSGLGMDAAGYRMAERLLATIATPAKFTPMTIDGTAKVLVASLVGGFPGLSPRADYANAGMVIFAGVNPMISHGHNIAMLNPAFTIKAVAERGSVWVIDPRRNESAAFATRHVAPNPGADYAIFAYLIRELLERSEESPAQPVIGLDQLRAAVASFNSTYAATVAGIAESDLEELYCDMRKAGRVAIETGTGITMAESANVSIWLAWALMILTGSMNRPGGVWFHPGFINRLDTWELPLVSSPYSPGAPSRPELRGLIGDWPCAALPDEIEAGNIRAFINLGGSLVRSFPDANRLIPALEKLELLATFEIVANETTALSTHILPTKDQTERPDITLWDMLASGVTLQYAPALVAPQGERRSAWWILAGLIERLGGVLPEGTPVDDRMAGADDAMLAALMTNARCTFEEVVAKGSVEHSLEFPADWVDAHISRLGGWQLAPDELAGQLHKLVRTSAKVQQFRLIPRRQRRHVNAQLLFLGDTADLLIHPDDAVAAGIADGALVHVSTDSGQISVNARFDAAMRRGVISVPHGHRQANVNLLTNVNQADPLTGMALYGGFPVKLVAA